MKFTTKARPSRPPYGRFSRLFLCEHCERLQRVTVRRTVVGEAKWSLICPDCGRRLWQFDLEDDAKNQVELRICKPCRPSFLSTPHRIDVGTCGVCALVAVLEKRWRESAQVQYLVDNS